MSHVCAARVSSEAEGQAKAAEEEEAEEAAEEGEEEAEAEEEEAAEEGEEEEEAEAEEEEAAEEGDASVGVGGRWIRCRRRRRWGWPAPQKVPRDVGIEWDRAWGEVGVTRRRTRVLLRHHEVALDVHLARARAADLQLVHLRPRRRCRWAWGAGDTQRR